LAPVAFSNRALAWLTTAGQPFCASLCSQTVTVLPLPAAAFADVPLDFGFAELLQADAANMTVDAMTTALAIDRFTPALQGLFRQRP
jgi:hypothetical protein